MLFLDTALLFVLKQHLRLALELGQPARPGAVVDDDFDPVSLGQRAKHVVVAGAQRNGANPSGSGRSQQFRREERLPSTFIPRRLAFLRPPVTRRPMHAVENGWSLPGGLAGR